MNVFSPIRKLQLALICSLFFGLFSLPVSANDHGGGGAPEPLVFTVNLGTKNYLQFGLVIEAATPEAAHEIAAYRPKIQHEIILLVSDKVVDHLRTLDGKKELIEEILETVNHLIHETEKTGVKEVLFTKFIIQ